MSSERRATAGDADSDGGVDLIDFGAFIGCSAAKSGSTDAESRCSFDLDRDGDVGFADFAVFHDAFTGG